MLWGAPLTNLGKGLEPPEPPILHVPALYEWSYRDCIIDSSLMNCVATLAYACWIMDLRVWVMEWVYMGIYPILRFNLSWKIICSNLCFDFKSVSTRQHWLTLPCLASWKDCGPITSTEAEELKPQNYFRTVVRLSCCVIMKSKIVLQGSLWWLWPPSNALIIIISFTAGNSPSKYTSPSRVVGFW